MHKETPLITLQPLLRQSGGGGTAEWLLFTYRLPSEPSTKRVLVWRRLRRLGAVSQPEGGHLLPLTPRTLEQLQWLQAEVGELGGEASLWQVDPVPPGRSEALQALFRQQLEEPYASVEAAVESILARLSAPLAHEELLTCEEDYQTASRRYLALRAVDYFGCSQGAEARSALESCSAAIRAAAEGLYSPEPRGEDTP